MKRFDMTKARVGCVAHAIQLAREQQDCSFMEVMMMIEMAHNSIVLEMVKKLCQQLTAKTPEQQEAAGVHAYYGARGIKHCCDLILKDIKRYEDDVQDMLKISRKNNEGEYKDLSEQERYWKFTSQLAASLSESDSMLGKVIDEMRAYFVRHTPKYGDIKPLDPEVLQNLMLTFVLVELGTATYITFCNGMPKYKCRATSFLAMTEMCNRMKSLFQGVKFLNQYGQPLRDSRYPICKNPELMGKRRTEEGYIVDGLVARYRDVLVSTKFIDRIMYLRDGVDYGWRNIRPSLFVNGVQTIDVPKDISDLQHP